MYINEIGDITLRMEPFFKEEFFIRWNNGKWVLDNGKAKVYFYQSYKSPTKCFLKIKWVRKDLEKYCLFWLDAIKMCIEEEVLQSGMIRRFKNKYKSHNIRDFP